jgi:3-hydroxyisobutyrate dehydrogenase-like beta-hydroxyacid dehydrogenase
LKDAKLALSAAEAVHVPLPFGSVLRDNFIEAIAHGDGKPDWSALAKVIFMRAGLENRVTH